MRPAGPIEIRGLETTSESCSVSHIWEAKKGQSCCRQAVVGLRFSQLNVDGAVWEVVWSACGSSEAAACNDMTDHYCVKILNSETSILVCALRGHWHESSKISYHADCVCRASTSATCHAFLACHTFLRDMSHKKCDTRECSCS